MNAKRLLVLAFTLFAFVGISRSQNVISGKVIDSSNGEPLLGASVAIKGYSAGTITDVNGEFRFEFREGEFTLSISYVGYVNATKEINVDGKTNLGTIELKPDAIGLEEVKVMANFAKDRQTPVSISRVQPVKIEEKLGTQEFPEILKSTPSVYTNKQGGGFGDSEINLRGFSSNNIGVLINGVPVNDMENGRVYWSNWAGLSDVTRTMQVQRGLGASNLAISSVGGTINIITQSTDAEAGGSVEQTIAHDNRMKTGFTVSTGLLDNGWAVTLSGAKESGDGYVDATDFRSYSYFFNVSKRINDDHSLSLTGFGAPQWHNQRSVPHKINFYRNHPDGIKLNTDYGFRHGEKFNTGYAYNEYHKPQFSLNHYYTINNNTTLNTAVYASFGRGGGRRISGPNQNWLLYDYPEGVPYSSTQITPEGYLDFDWVIDQNSESMTGSKAIVSMSSNEHDWYGILSSFNTKVGNVNITAGLDGRYYKGYHFREIKDLLGGDYYLNDANINRDPGTPLQVGDKFDYYNLGEVFWAGSFLQGEYVTDQFSAFLSGSLSNKSYRRVDYFQYEPGNQTSKWVDFITYSGKGGVNYNINDKHNVFANAGYFTRAPFFTTMFVNYTNEINEEAKKQRVLSGELGYGYVSGFMKVDMTLYHTRWMDKTLSQNLGRVTANITGLNAIHQGFEMTVQAKPTDKINIDGMLSIGDWKWQDDVSAGVYDDRQQFVDSISVYAGDVHVGGSAQTTAALGVDMWVLPDVKVGVNFNHYNRLFADFDVENRTLESEAGEDSWQMPDYQIFDVNVRYNFELAGFEASLFGNVNNLFDTKHISWAQDGAAHNAATSSVWYGFGRTWSLNLKVKF